MIEINFIALEDALNDARIESLKGAFVKMLVNYIKADKKYQRVVNINCLSRNWEDDLLEDPAEYKAALDEAIDKAFTTFTIFHKEYKKLTNGRLYDGGIGMPKSECSDEQWASFREEKQDCLDEIIAYITMAREA